MAILIVTSMDFGGLTEILKIANDGGRFPNQFEFDPRYRLGIHAPEPSGSRSQQPVVDRIRSPKRPVDP